MRAYGFKKILIFYNRFKLFSPQKLDDDPIATSDADVTLWRSVYIWFLGTVIFVPLISFTNY